MGAGSGGGSSVEKGVAASVTSADGRRAPGCAVTVDARASSCTRRAGFCRNQARVVPGLGGRDVSMSAFRRDAFQKRRHPVLAFTRGAPAISSTS